MTGVRAKGGIKSTARDPAWRWRRALGHKVVKSRKLYTRKTKHKPRDERGFFYEISASTPW